MKLNKADVERFRERAVYYFNNDSKHPLDNESDFRMKCFIKAAEELFLSKGVKFEAGNILFDERSSDLSSVDD